MWRDRWQSWRAAVLPLVLLLGAAWTTVFGVTRVEPAQRAELPRAAAVAAMVPPSITPALPQARLAAKPSAKALVLLVAAVVALLLVLRRRPGWQAATGSAGVPIATDVLRALRGRAPPRRSA